MPNKGRRILAGTLLLTPTAVAIGWGVADALVKPTGKDIDVAQEKFNRAEKERKSAYKEFSNESDNFAQRQGALCLVAAERFTNTSDEELLNKVAESFLEWGVEDCRYKNSLGEDITGYVDATKGLVKSKGTAANASYALEDLKNDKAETVPRQASQMGLIGAVVTAALLLGLLMNRDLPEPEPEPGIEIEINI